VALVVEGSASSKRELHLGKPLPEVDRERDQRKALLLEATSQAVDLVPVEKELADAVRLVATEAAGVLVRADHRLEEVRFAVSDARVGIPQLEVTIAQRLDLAAGEDEAGLEGLEDLVLVASTAVLGYDADRWHRALGGASRRLPTRTHAFSLRGASVAVAAEGPVAEASGSVVA